MKFQGNIFGWLSFFVILAMVLPVSSLESALAVSDDHRKGLIKDLAFIDAMCVSAAARIAGRTDVVLPEISPANELPLVLAKTFIKGSSVRKSHLVVRQNRYEGSQGKA